MPYGLPKKESAVPSCFMRCGAISGFGEVLSDRLYFLSMLEARNAKIEYLSKIFCILLYFWGKSGIAAEKVWKLVA